MRILKRDLTHWFIRDHGQLPDAYLRSCKKFFKELSDKRQATSCVKVYSVKKNYKSL